jgi:hypothetical protein
VTHASRCQLCAQQYDATPSTSTTHQAGRLSPSTQNYPYTSHNHQPQSHIFPLPPYSDNLAHVPNVQDMFQHRKSLPYYGRSTPRHVRQTFISNQTLLSHSKADNGTMLLTLLSNPYYITPRYMLSTSKGPTSLISNSTT